MVVAASLEAFMAPPIRGALVRQLVVQGPLAVQLPLVVRRPPVAQLPLVIRRLLAAQPLLAVPLLLVVRRPQAVPPRPRIAPRPTRMRKRLRSEISLLVIHECK